MLEKTARASLLRPSRQPLATCLLCQWRNFSTTHPRLAQKPEPYKERFAKGPTKALKDVQVEQSQAIYAPRSYGKRLSDFTPTPLPRPIGMSSPPVPWENTGIDERTWRERRDDFVDYDKHIQRREQLKKLVSRPYFRDWGNLSMHKGKSFLAPPRPFKYEHSLYFPNFYGQTVDPAQKTPRDTTSVLQGKVSVVALFSTGWGEKQVMSFISKPKNKALHEVLENNEDVAQLVRINVEDTSRLKYWLIRMFFWNIRKVIDEKNWGRYFVVRSGITDEIRESIGYLNSKVGYVYLVDEDCKIRWAGSGPAERNEVGSLANGLQTLLTERKSRLRNTAGPGKISGRK